jgi:hypothetical protein
MFVTGKGRPIHEHPRTHANPSRTDARRARTRGALSLAYFSLGTQREVGRAARRAVRKLLLFASSDEAKEQDRGECGAHGGPGPTPYRSRGAAARNADQKRPLFASSGEAAKRRSRTEASMEPMVGQGPPFYEPTCVKCLDWDSRVAVLWFRLLGCWIGLPWCVSSLTECRRCVAWARCASPPSIRLPRWADRSPIARCAWVPDLTIRAPSIETVGSDQGGPRARIDSSTRYAGQPLGEWGLGYVVCFGPLAPRCAVLRPPAWPAQASAVRLPAPRRS